MQSQDPALSEYLRKNGRISLQPRDRAQLLLVPKLKKGGTPSNFVTLGDYVTRISFDDVPSTSFPRIVDSVLSSSRIIPADLLSRIDDHDLVYTEEEFEASARERAYGRLATAYVLNQICPDRTIELRLGGRAAILGEAEEHKASDIGGERCGSIYDYDDEMSDFALTFPPKTSCLQARDQSEARPKTLERVTDWFEKVSKACRNHDSFIANSSAILGHLLGTVSEGERGSHPSSTQQRAQLLSGGRIWLRCTPDKYHPITFDVLLGLSEASDIQKRELFFQVAHALERRKSDLVVTLGDRIVCGYGKTAEHVFAQRENYALGIFMVLAMGHALLDESMRTIQLTGRGAEIVSLIKDIPQYDRLRKLTSTYYDLMMAAGEDAVLDLAEEAEDLTLQFFGEVKRRLDESRD